MMNGASILVTGASGFTGWHACRYFMNLGMQVTALVRRANPELAAAGMRVIVCDLLDGAAVAAALHDAAPDYVLHLAGVNAVTDSWKQPIHTMQVNVMGTIHVVDALRTAPHIRALIITSKLKAPLSQAGTPVHPYAFSKSIQELAARAWSKLFGLDVILAEPSNLIGPGPSTGICSLLGQYIAKRERGWDSGDFLLSSRSVMRDYLDVRDAVAAYEKLLQAGEAGTVYSVQSGIHRSLGDIADTFRRMALTDVLFRWQDESSSLEGGGTTPTPIAASNSAYSDHVEQAAQTLPAALDWQPARAFEHSVADILNYHRNSYGGEESS
ncbi:NAD-dependent epimerase/dehydratase family protein [Paenibacillus marinisediminis]